MNDAELGEAVKGLDLIPLSGRIIVKEKEVSNYGSIIIPENSKELRATEGVVLAVADDVDNIIVGDVVYYGRYSGILVNRGEKFEHVYYLMNSEDVLCFVKTEEGCTDA